MRIVVSVSHTFCKYSLLEKTIDMAIGDKNKASIEIISAHVNGASSLILKYCLDHCVRHRHFRIHDYFAFGKNAETIRNSNMINYAKQDEGVMFAFWDGKSRNTDFVIRTALNQRIDGYIMNFAELTLTDLISAL